MERKNIDHLINWPDFYRQYIHTPITTAGDGKMQACCPFHRERKPSWGFSVQNGLYKCQSCGEQGNGTTFLARMENISTGEAYKRLCEIANVKPEKPAEAHYTVREYAFEKRLPEEFLKSLGVKDGYKQHYIEIPYMDEAGNVVARRMRMPRGNDPRFKWRKDSKATLYGLWRMEEVRDAGYVLLVEGESDAQTLWLLGIQALGLPGASTFKAEYAQIIEDIPAVYVHVEPDMGGKTARRRICEALQKSGYQGTVRAFSCAAHEGVKDPSSLFIKESDRAASIIWEIAKAAPVINLDATDLKDPPGLEDAPIKLQIPSEYEINGNGIYEYDKKTGSMDYDPFCWTPILITRTLVGISGDVKMELAFKRGNEWQTVRYPRTVLASARSIVALSEYGMDVNSENGGVVVKWLSALERCNIGSIPQIRRISHYGWIDDHSFMPYKTDGFMLDHDAAMAGYATVGTTRGDYDVWRMAMHPHRERSLFRFILSASFAAPLLKILSQRIFMVYNWGNSKGGKTVSMMAGLSVWGEPEQMRMSFNSTQVGIERTVSFFNDLPLGLNERQLAGTRQEYIERIVYMLSEGKGKSRGSKDGGLQQQSTWRSVILANGETELVMGATATGVSTRALELYGQPFTEESEAAEMYGVVEGNYGHAGAEFIRKLVDANNKEICNLYNSIKDDLIVSCPGNSRAHIASVAVVAVADFLASTWIWGESNEDAGEAASGMAREIMGMLNSAAEDDTNAKAYRFIVDWVLSHRQQFTDDYHGQRFGRTEDYDDNYVLVFPSVLKDALEGAGFSYNKTIRWLEENALLKVVIRRDRDVTRPTVQKRIDGRVAYMHSIKITDVEAQDDMLHDGLSEAERGTVPF